MKLCREDLTRVPTREEILAALDPLELFTVEYHNYDDRIVDSIWSSMDKASERLKVLKGPDVEPPKLPKEKFLNLGDGWSEEDIQTYEDHYKWRRREYWSVHKMILDRGDDNEARTHTL